MGVPVRRQRHRLSSIDPQELARHLQGSALSYNNYADADAALALAAEFAAPVVAIVKHANPCGVALGASLRAAWERALACDPLSAFGGVVAVNRPLDPATAERLAKPGENTGHRQPAWIVQQEGFGRSGRTHRRPSPARILPTRSTASRCGSSNR